MSRFDLATAQIVPSVTLVDASLQDHSTGDKQFPGLHNDLLFLWAMVDTANGRRYQMVRTVSASAAFDFTLQPHLRLPGNAQRGRVRGRPRHRLAARHRAGAWGSGAGQELVHNGGHPTQLGPKSHRGQPCNTSRLGR